MTLLLQSTSELTELFDLESSEELLERFACALLQTYTCAHNDFTPEQQVRLLWLCVPNLQILKLCIVANHVLVVMEQLVGQYAHHICWVQMLQPYETSSLSCHLLLAQDLTQVFLPLQLPFPGTLYITAQHTCFSSCTGDGQEIVVKLQHSHVTASNKVQPKKRGQIWNPSISYIWRK